MPKFIETRSDICIFDLNIDETNNGNRKFSYGVEVRLIYTPNFDELGKKLEELCEALSDSCFEIKGIMPLQQGISHTYGEGVAGGGSIVTDNISGTHGEIVGGYGLGFGYGLAPIYGYLVLSQRIEEVSQEVFDQRVADRAKRKAKEADIKETHHQIVALLKSFEDLKATLRKAHEEASTAREIREEKKFFGGARFLIGDRSFDTKEAATDYQASLTAALAQAQEKFSTAEATQQTLNARLAALQAESA